MSKVILIIDDDPDIIDAARAVLDARGFRVITAMSGEEGAKMFESSAPHLVLCDMMMERVDAGTKAAGAIRELNKTVPIYLMSSVAAATDGTVGADNMGFSGILQKPLDPDKLVRAVERALR
jgi:CheY-like chemotaxis protein